MYGVYALSGPRSDDQRIREATPKEVEEWEKVISNPNVDHAILVRAWGTLVPCFLMKED